MLPDDHTAAVAAALARRTGLHVARGLLDDLVDAIDPAGRAEHRGELLGARTANLLPGVWSARLDAEAGEPPRRAGAARVGRAVGGAGTSTRHARRAAIAAGRVAHAAAEPRARLDLRLLAGRGPPPDAHPLRPHDRAGGADHQPRARTARGSRGRAAGAAQHRASTSRCSTRHRSRGTDVVRIPLDGFPVFFMSDITQDIHPLTVAAGSVAGYTVDGAPVRVIQSDDPGRVRMLESLPALDVELVVVDVPAFGYQRIRLTPAEASPDEHDGGRDIKAGSVFVHADDDGTLRVRIGELELAGLAAIEHVADRGDSYDFDPVPDDPGDHVDAVDVRRRRHPSGIERLTVTRTMASGTVVRVEARVVPSVERVDLHVDVEHPAPDHRLRLCFPTGAPVDIFRAATTFDTVHRSTTPVDDASLGAPRAAHLPAPGMGQGEWPDGRGTRPARGGGDRGRRDRGDAAPHVRLARPLPAGEPTRPGRSRAPDTRRSAPGRHLGRSRPERRHARTGAAGGRARVARGAGGRSAARRAGREPPDARARHARAVDAETGRR